VFIRGKKQKRMMAVNVDVQYATEAPNLPDKNSLTQWVSMVLKQEKREKEALTLTIRIVDENEASQLNERWRQRKAPTNVLSFPFECPPNIAIPLLGDIVICAPLIAREAIVQDKSLQAHWAHIVIHGTLHLLGYDHKAEQPAQLMEKIEISLLHELGYSNPYH